MSIHSIIAAEGAKQGFKLGPKVVGQMGVITGAAVQIVVTMAQEANNTIKIDLCAKRHDKKLIYVRNKNDLQNELTPLKRELKENEDELDQLTGQIQDEEKRMSTFANVKNDKNIKFIVALGNTGHGKSTVFNRLCGDISEEGDQGPFTTGDFGDSVTQLVEHKELTINSVKSVVVDTPGYNDTQNRDNLHFDNLETYLYGCGGVDAFLLVCNGTIVRFDLNFQNMLKEYEMYFGSKFWKHLVVILTRIESREKKKFDERKKGLQANFKKYFSQIGNDDIPVIAIGFDDDSKEFCKSVINQVLKIANADAKLVCRHIQSPIKKMKRDKKMLEDRNFTINAEIVSKQCDIDENDERIDALKLKLENPEYFPLITNRNAQI